MRVLKFRAWCKSLRQPEMRLFTLDDLQTGAFAIHPDDEVMEWTGLHDKNGKEIYEGDILKHIPDGNEPHALLTVNWHPENCCFGLDGYMQITTGDVECRTVIGDIYENPSVLTV